MNQQALAQRADNPAEAQRIAALRQQILAQFPD